MKQSVIIASVIILFGFLTVGCTGNFNKATTLGDTTISEKSLSEETTQCKEEVETNWILNEVYVNEGDWNDFVEELYDTGVISESHDTVKKSVLTNPIEISGYSINYLYYEDHRVNADKWNFSVCWQDKSVSYSNVIDFDLFFVDNIDSEALLRGYELYDSENNIFTTEGSFGKQLFICPINDNAYIRFAINSDLQDYDQIYEILRDHAVEIKSVFNN